MGAPSTFCCAHVRASSYTYPMKVRMLIVALALAHPVFSQTARNYYDELYKAGGLDGAASMYACFDDRAESTEFFTFVTSDVVKDYLIENGKFAALPAAQKADLNKGWLHTRVYFRGVPAPNENVFHKDGDAWGGEKTVINGVPMRIRLMISMQTLRYSRDLEFLSAVRTLHADTATYGRCEMVSPAVAQKTY